MRSTISLAVLTALAAVLVAAATAMPAAAKSGPEVIKTGKCTNGATWKLKAKRDDGRIEAEFEVDQNRVGRRWRVTLSHNGRAIFSGIRRTLAPSGSFTVERRPVDAPGADRISASARALAGGTCSASLSI